MRARLVPSLLLLASSLSLHAEPTAGATVVQLPVVLDVHGIGGSHYTSDLTIVNLGTTESPVELTFTRSAPEAVTPFKAVTTENALAPATRFYTADVIAYLRNHGLALPSDGSPVIGTLSVRLPLQSGDEARPFVGTRISTPNPSTAVGGSFGTYTLGNPVGSSVNTLTYIAGLRENASYRTNMAFVHAGGGTNQPVGVQVQIFNGDTGTIVGDPIAVTLQPGEWKQMSSILATTGVAQGWARVTQTSGSDRFLVYAVVNDGGSSGGGTSDGSWIDPGTSEGMLPIVLGKSGYRTELVLTNTSSLESSVTLNYVPATALGTEVAGGGIVRVSMPPRTQIIEPDAIAFLRRLGLPIPDDNSQGGSLRVAGAAALARVYITNPDASVGGTFGLAFPATPIQQRATTEAWVYGLRQDAATRSNVAVVNAIPSGTTNSVFEVTIFDAVRGVSRMLLTKPLAPGQWYQWNAILSMVPNLQEGYVRIRCTNLMMPCDFAAYGVVNDGATPVLGTSDGSFIPMSNVK